jgi:glycosyltransferase involved in cell wall biosynthesis
MTSAMILDLIIPTFNRHLMLRRTLESLLDAVVPSGLEVRVTVVDNNSMDETRTTVEAYSARFKGGLNYVFEGRQGRSYALNAGIAATNGELIGMIDDDEEIGRSWYSSIHSVFSRGGIDFIGGPYVPRWGAEAPKWLPTEYCGAIGWIDGGDRVVPFDESYPGILMGGNAVLTRAIVHKVGYYNTNLGRNGKRLLAGEDDEMYRRLLSAGARIPPERLLKGYFRRWCFWRGVSSGVIDRERRMPVVYFGGIPRYLLGNAARGLCAMLSGLVVRRVDLARSFGRELAIWDAVGFFYGKHFYRVPGPTKSAGSAPVRTQLQNGSQSADLPTLGDSSC